jgi:hypothetical protein
MQITGFIKMQYLRYISLAVSFTVKLLHFISSILLDFAVPYLSSNVPFSVHDFKWVFHFHARQYIEMLSFMVLPSLFLLYFLCFYVLLFSDASVSSSAKGRSVSLWSTLYTPADINPPMMGAAQ